jgi:iron uptake system component EfeO
MFARPVLTHRCKPPQSLALATGLVGTLVLSACGSSGGSAGSAGVSTGGSSATIATDAHVANVSMTSAKCVTDRQSYDSGGITFKVSNASATGVSEVELLQGERILGERENLPPGFSGTFSLSLQPGSYTLYCPGATTERVPLTITGTASTAAAGSTHDLLVAGTKTYGTYIESQVAELLASVQTLSTALSKPPSAANLAAAQAAYDKARPYYERIEPVAESFNIKSGSLDAAIDSRVGDVPLAKLTGFHRIEYGLFVTKSLTGLGTYGTGLVGYVQQLSTLVKGLTYQPAELANGASDLLNEVQTSKITGEEERYSHIDILDFQANVEGSEQAFANLQPGLAKIDPTLTSTISTAFSNVDNLLDKYRTTSNPSGFVYYGTLTTADKQALAQAVRTVQEPLSQVAGKVVNG